MWRKDPSGRFGESTRGAIVVRVVLLGTAMRRRFPAVELCLRAVRRSPRREAALAYPGVRGRHRQRARLVAAQRLTRHPHPAHRDPRALAGPRPARDPRARRPPHRRRGRPCRGPDRAAWGGGPEGVRPGARPRRAHPGPRGPRPLCPLGVVRQPRRGRLRPGKRPGRHRAPDDHRDPEARTAAPTGRPLGDGVPHRGPGHRRRTRLRTLRPGLDGHPRRPADDGQLRGAGRHLLHRGGGGHDAQGRPRRSAYQGTPARLGPQGSLARWPATPRSAGSTPTSTIRTRCSTRARRRGRR